MPFITARVVSVIRTDAIAALADAGDDQSVLCASLVQLQGQILGDDAANHTFEWEETLPGGSITLINANTLSPSFLDPGSSDIVITLYVDRNTPFEASDAVLISATPTTTTRGGTTTSHAQQSKPTSTGAFAAFASSGMGLLDSVDIDFKVGAYSYNYPPDATYSPIYKAEDLVRIKDNLRGNYWLMRDIDLSDYPNWDPIGTINRPFTGDFQGNGFKIDNLSITSTPVAVSGGDSDFGNVTMNNDFEGTDGDQFYTGPFGDVWSFDNQADISSDQAFTGSTSLYMDGVGDRAYTPNGPGLFGSGDFTIEFYAYPLDDDNNQFIANVWSGSNNRSWSFDMGVNNNLAFSCYGSSTGNIILNAGLNTINSNVWTHVCAMRKGTNIYLFSNGVLKDTDTIGASETLYMGGVTPTSDIYIGRRPGNLTHYHGHIDNFRLTKAARYDETGFAPPTSFPNDVLKDAGLFSSIGNGATIENLGVTDANISGVADTFYKGVLAGTVTGAATVLNSYTEGTVDSDGDLAGGFIGNTGTDAGSTFTNTYADVTVTGGGTDTGGWAGTFDGTPTYVENYSDTDKTTAVVGTGSPGATEVSGLTTAQLTAEANYTDWDFTSTWEIDEGVSPATLQNNVFDRVASEGAWLTTGLPQAALWNPPNKSTGGNIQAENKRYLGLIIEDQNPATNGWENRRFIPYEQQSALLTPGRRHRAFTVLNIEQTTKSSRDRVREVTYKLPRTIVPKTETGSHIFAGGTTPMFGTTYPGSATASKNLSITKTNPRRISKSVEEGIAQSIQGSNAAYSDTSVIVRYIGTSKLIDTALTTEASGVYAPGDAAFTASVSITRAYGGSIGG